MSEPCMPGCQTYWPGHHMHPIHARLTGESPWGWRDAVVSGVDGEWLCLGYVEADGRPRVWNHTMALDEFPAGTPVRLHERLYVLGSPRGWLNVIVEDGIGPVPEPEDPDLWSAERSPGVVDMGTGRGVATDHPEPD